MARYKVICGKFVDKKFISDLTFTGPQNGLQFVDGIAETDHKGARYIAQDLGYQLVDTEAPTDDGNIGKIKKK